MVVRRVRRVSEIPENVFSCSGYLSLLILPEWWRSSMPRIEIRRFGVADSGRVRHSTSQTDTCGEMEVCRSDSFSRRAMVAILR